MNYIIKKKNGELYHAGVKGMKWDFSKRKYHFDTSNLQAYREQIAKMYGQARGAVGSAYRTAKPYAQTAYNTARSAAGSAYGQAKGAVNGYINKKRAQKTIAKDQRDGMKKTAEMQRRKMADIYKKQQAQTAVNKAQRDGMKRGGTTVSDLERQRRANNVRLGGSASIKRNTNGRKPGLAKPGLDHINSQLEGREGRINDLNKSKYVMNRPKRKPGLRKPGLPSITSPTRNSQPSGGRRKPGLRKPGLPSLTPPVRNNEQPRKKRKPGLRKPGLGAPRKVSTPMANENYGKAHYTTKPNLPKKDNHSDRYATKPGLSYYKKKGPSAKTKTRYKIHNGKKAAKALNAGRKDIYNSNLPEFAKKSLMRKYYRNKKRHGGSF